MKQREEAKNVIVATIEGITKKKRQKKSVDYLRQYLKTATITAAVQNNVVGQLKQIVKGDYPPDASTVFMGLLGYRTEKLVLTDDQKKHFTAIYKMVEKTKTLVCDHKFAIIPLLYGGGFTPTYTLPELFCSKCCLNVTIRIYNTPTDTEKAIGLRVPIRLNRALKKWCDFIKSKSRVLSSRGITENPMKVFNESVKYDGDIGSLMVVDKELFERQSGI